LGYLFALFSWISFFGFVIIQLFVLSDLRNEDGSRISLTESGFTVCVPLCLIFLAIRVFFIRKRTECEQFITSLRGLQIKQINSNRLATTMIIFNSFGGIGAGIISILLFPLDRWSYILGHSQYALSLRVIGGIVTAYHFGSVFLLVTFINYALLHFYYDVQSISIIAVSQTNDTDLIGLWGRYRAVVKKLQQVNMYYIEFIFLCNIAGGALAVQGILNASIHTSPFLAFLTIANWVTVFVALMAVAYGIQSQQSKLVEKVTDLFDTKNSDERNKLVTFLSYVQGSQVSYRIFRQPVTVQVAFQYATLLSSIASILLAIGAHLK